MAGDDVTPEMTAGVERLDAELRQIGLYLDDYNFIEDPAGRRYLVADFLLGDVALSDRVLDPDKHTVDKQMAGLEQSYASAEVDELRRRIAGGGPILGGDDAG